MTVHGEDEGRKLPASEVAGEQEHAFAAGAGMLVVFESVVDDDLVDVVERVLGKVTDLGELTAERGELSAENAGALGSSFVGECHGEIAHADLAQARVEKIDEPAEADADGAGQRARQNAEEFDERPGCRVLESLPH